MSTPMSKPRIIPDAVTDRQLEASDPERGKSLAVSARRIVLQELTWETVLPPVVARMRELARARR